MRYDGAYILILTWYLTMQTLTGSQTNLILISGLFKKMNERSKCAKLSQKEPIDNRLSAEDESRPKHLHRDINKNKGAC